MVLRYARHAQAGRLEPRKLSRFLDRQPTFPEPFKVISRLAKTDNVSKVLSSFHPIHPQFALLRKQLAKLRKANTKPKKYARIPAGPILRPGMVHRQIPLLRKRLGLSVPRRGGKNVFKATVYDSRLEAAVRAFQSANGLKSEGIIGPRTRKAMNRRQPDRTRQIMANMERWRWLPRKLGKMHVRVNVPEFLVRVIKNDKLLFKQKVIVGKVSNKTPIFSDTMETIVFNPFWNVPQSIVWNVMGGNVPRGFEGRQVNGRLYVRQPPGPTNALGKVKFMFPNRHAVYLHDTPTKSLFRPNRRTFSYGCVRVKNPRRFAEVLLQNTGTMSQSRLDRTWRSLRNRPVSLTNKIPVHITYFTAWVGKDGKMSYYRDVYGHDRRVAAALFKRPIAYDRGQKINRPSRRAGALSERRRSSQLRRGYSGRSSGNSAPLSSFFDTLFGG